MDQDFYQSPATSEPCSLWIRRLQGTHACPRPKLLATAERQRYGAVVLPLGFKFDVDAVLVDATAHRSNCDRLPRPLPHDAVSVRVGWGFGVWDD